MHGRRRTTAVLPSGRLRDSTSRLSSNSAVDSVRVTRRHGPVGAAYLSSDSSGSRSSSPTLPVRTGQVAAEIRGASRPRRRRLRTDNDSVVGTSPSNPLRRCPLTSNPKPMARSRRVFRIILSPNGTAQADGEVTREGEHSVTSSLSRIDASSQDSLLPLREPAPPPPPPPLERIRPLSSRRRRSSRIVNVPSARLSNLIRHGLEHLYPESRTNADAPLDSAELRAALDAVRSSEHTDDDCVICLDPKSNRSIILPCMHTFCFECIRRWLLINPSCPLCKRMAYRLIHSILSDSEFTEILVSNLRARSSPLPPLLEPRPINLDAIQGSDRMSSSYPQHHHYHYYMGEAPGRFLNMVTRVFGQNEPSADPNRFDSTPGSVSLRQRAQWSVTGQVDRSFQSLFTLIDAALVPRGSYRWDNLLLRQLVYVFRLDTRPFPDGLVLSRSINASYLAQNEAQRHRLIAFVRRDLRVIAPWLAYNTTSSVYSRSGTSSSADTLEVTAPLINGAPGSMAETPQLDTVVDLILAHVTRVDMTNERAFVAFLSTIPALAPPLVPTTYLTHFVSELVQFARYSGTIEQYDNAVCLYPSPANLRDTSQLHVATEAVYLGPLSYPRHRPGLHNEAQFTQELLTFLMGRLFIHSRTGNHHPACLPRTGEIPTLLLNDDTEITEPQFTSCHPRCIQRTRVCRLILQAVEPLVRIGFSARFPSNLATASVYPVSSSNSSTRLLFQRVLSELLDHARFNEALSPLFSQYRTGDLADQSQRSPPDNCFRPVLDAQPFALRRLVSVARLLYTSQQDTREPGLSVDRWFDTLLHLPLVALDSFDPADISREDTSFVDLTSIRTMLSSISDWNFLRLPPWEPPFLNILNRYSPLTTPGQNVSDPIDLSSSRETGWRDRSGSCVVISDSSGEEEQVLESNDGQNTEAVEEATVELDPSPSLGNEDEDPVLRPDDDHLSEIENASLNLSLRPGSANDAPTEVQDEASNSESHPVTSVVAESCEPGTSQVRPEPMEVDYSVSSRRSKRSENSEGGSSSSLRPSKLARIDSLFADLMARIQDSLAPSLREQPEPRHRKYESVFRHLRRRLSTSLSRTRSPIHVDSSESDCEVINEYIHVDSCTSSSSRSSSCSSASSSSSLRHRSRSPVHRSSRCCSKHAHHGCRRSHRNRHRRRAICHHRHSCCRHSKHRRNRHSHRHTRPVLQPLVTQIRSAQLVNNASSPIVISDDSESEHTSPVSMTTPIPNSNNSTDDVKHETLSPICAEPVPSTSRVTFNQAEQQPSIFEPSSVDDFYRFLERFHPTSSTSTLDSSRHSSGSSMRPSQREAAGSSNSNNPTAEEPPPKNSSETS